MGLSRTTGHGRGDSGFRPRSRTERGGHRHQPSPVGGPGQSLVVSKSSKNPELAVKFLSFINSKDEVLKFYKTQVKVPVRKDLTAADLNLQPGSVGDKLFKWSTNYVFWVDNSLSGPVVDSFTKLLPLVLTGKMTPEDFAVGLDKAKGQK